MNDDCSRLPRRFVNPPRPGFAGGGVLLAVAALVAAAWSAQAQPRPYIGYVYPAGGQQGTTVRVRLGGQGLNDVHAVLVTGSGVTAHVAEYLRRLGPQEMKLIHEQLKELRRATSSVARAKAPAVRSASKTDRNAADADGEAAPANLVAKLETRVHEYVQTPACAAISSLVMVDVTIAPEAEPGARELRLVTARGVSNPLVFHVGQLREYSRKPMRTAPLQVLGKEAQALRQRPPEEVEDRVVLPCTLNGQIASGEINQYRFAARRGQRLVVITQARQLVPFIADAVPGWFQPVLVLRDAHGKEVAYADDYRYQPDPVMLFEVPAAGDYVLTIYDAIYRGREDFVYRLSVGSLPFVTSLFPLGAPAAAPRPPRIRGWNLEEAELVLPARGAGPGIHPVVARAGKFLSNPVPYALDTLPEGWDRETNNTPARAQKVTLPIMVNGRIDRPGDWDVFEFRGRSNDTLVAEVKARRLDSPLDSVIQLTDASGRLLAFSDDREDLAAGLNTHHADSWFTARLPADGVYHVRLGDVSGQGGDAYAYRLRLSRPQPDFALRVVPSSIAFRGKSSAAVTVYAVRRDGFSGPIRLTLHDPPAGFSAAPVTLPADKTVGHLTLRSGLASTAAPVNLSVVGSARIGKREVVRAAVPAEDRMQAFLWRHLVPASDLKALVYNPGKTQPPRRIARAQPAPAGATNTVAAATNAMADAQGTAAKPKFTAQQIAGRLRQLKLLFDEGVLTDAFYNAKVAECHAGQ
ncbi:MAG: hypothetical protein JXQ71_07335 [Verrucomicrobia bacterium]|nr:hypothetical protein [Verrucomicrobiota bacterium]